MATANPLAWLCRGPGRERRGEPGWTETQRHEVTAGAAPGAEPINFTMTIACPPEHELFEEWLAGLSPDERAAFEAKTRARWQARLAAKAAKG